MNEEKVIARLILSTKRKKRDFDLVQICSDIKWLLNQGMSLSGVAGILGISVGMLGQFLKVDELVKELRNLVQNRDIDSVTLVQNLSKFSEEDQKNIAKALINEEISSIDVRALSPLRRQFPSESINDLIKKLVASKNRKISVIKFPVESLKIGLSEFENKIRSLISSDHFESLIQNDDYCELRISKIGEKKLRQLAKKSGESLNVYFNNLLE